MKELQPRKDIGGFSGLVYNPVMTMKRTEAAPRGFLSTELANSFTHGVGFALSIAGLIVLVLIAARQDSPLHVVACSIYGSTLVLLYLASTLYHSIHEPRVKRILRIIDHVAIYLLIAGTYTPFTLIALRGAWGWSIFGVIWGLAAVGILLKIFFIGRFRIASVGVYLLMGWLCIIALKPLLDSLPEGGFPWLLAGGIAYTVGVVFFAWKSLPYSHAIWHLFVMTGSACHFFSVMVLVLPKSG